MRSGFDTADNKRNLGVIHRHIATSNKNPPQKIDHKDFELKTSLLLSIIQSDFELLTHLDNIRRQSYTLRNKTFLLLRRLSPDDEEQQALNSTILTYRSLRHCQRLPSTSAVQITLIFKWYFRRQSARSFISKVALAVALLLITSILDNHSVVIIDFWLITLLLTLLLHNTLFSKTSGLFFKCDDLIGRTVCPMGERQLAAVRRRGRCERSTIRLALSS